ncbi:hypothetical protein BDR26DRAFT_489201 [Obelidium mucronatum]|nr:hypothetical protein BDR26DRAFT_489201 [Obelidium mucronatum]
MQKKAILLFNWTPTKFVANTNLTKVLFPNNNPSQYAAFAKDMSKVLTTDPQSSILQKVASLKFVADFPELNSFVTKYQIPDDQINAMLKAMTHDSLDAAHVACLWLKNNQDLWDSWIPALPKSVVSCPIGMGRYLTGAAYSCISCPIGSYNWQPNNTQQCAPCPNNFDCQGGLTVNVLEGLWMPNRTDIPVAYTCPMHSSCCHQHSCPALTCAHNFKGILCTECAEEGFYLWGSECHQCGSAGGASFYAVVALAFVCAFALLLLPYEEAPTVELLFFYFQVARYIFETQVNGILNVPGISTFLSIASLNVDGFVTDCPLPLSGINKLLFRFFLPSLILVYIVTIYFGLRALNARFPKTHSILMSWAPEHLRHESVSLICFRAIIIVMTFVTMPLIDSSLLLLQCTEIEGKNVLSQVPQVECFSSQHAAAAALAVVVLIAMIVGLPCLISLVLYKLWKADLIVYDEEGLTPIQKLFQCLYIIFKPEMFYMLPVTIVEKGVISILFAMMSRYPSLVQMNTYIIVLSGLCGTRIYWQPFANHLEAYLNREIALGILAMIALRQFTDQYGVSNFALAEIGFAIFLPPVLHIIRWIQGNYQKHKEVIGQVIRKASLNGSKSSKSGFTDSNTESQSQTQTVTRKRTMIASGKKSSIEKLNASTRSNLRSFNASRKTINTLADENKPLNLNPTFP